MPQEVKMNFQRNKPGTVLTALPPKVLFLSFLVNFVFVFKSGKFYTNLLGLDLSVC
jgi:hypothetical protein